VEALYVDRIEPRGSEENNPVKFSWCASDVPQQVRVLGRSQNAALRTIALRPSFLAVQLTGVNK